MKFLLAYLFLIVCVIACEPCVGVICEPLSSFAVSFVDKTSQQDLYFGPGSSYDFDSLKIYSLHGSDSIFYNVSKSLVNGQDSVLTFQTDFTADVLFVQFSSDDTDTIQLVYENEVAECCPESKNLKHIFYGDKSYEPSNVLRFLK